MLVYILIYKFCLDLVYPQTEKIFRYLWLTKIDFELIKLIESYFYIIIIYFILEKLKHKLTKTLIYLIYIYLIIPSTTIYQYLIFKNTYLQILLVSFFIIISFFIFLEKLEKKNNNIVDQKKLNKKLKIMFYICLVISIVNIFLILKKYTYINPTIYIQNIAKIYIVRNTNKLQSIYAYLVPFQSYIVNSYLLYYGFLKRNKLILAIYFLFQLIIFIYFGHKVIFLYTLISIMLILNKSRLELSLSKINIFFLSINFLITKLDYKAVLDRGFYVPSLLGYKYYEFFSKNSFNYFYGTKLGDMFLVEKIYPKIYSKYISQKIFSKEMNANTGFIAAGYAEFGIIGVTITILLFILMLFFIKRYSNKKNKLILIYFLPIFLQLLNVNILTILLTNGVIVIIIILKILDNKRFLVRKEV